MAVNGMQSFFVQLRLINLISNLNLEV